MQYSAAIVLLLLPLLTSSYYVKVGILTQDLDAETTKQIWSMAQNYSTMMSMEPIVEEFHWREQDAAADLSRSICNLVSKGVDALAFLGPSLGSSLISSYSTHLGLPFIAAAENSENFGKYQVSMLPDTSKAAADFILHSGGWSKFVFFYDSHDGADRLQKILRLLADAEFVPQVDGFFKTPEVKTARMVIKELLPADVNRRIVLATSEKFADDLANELTQENNVNILLLTPVGIVRSSILRNQRYMYKLTKFSVVDAKNPFLVTLENRLRTLPSFHAHGRTRKNVPDSVIWHYDSSSVLNTMFNQIARENPSALISRRNLDCLEFSGEIPATANYLKQVSIEHGVTGRLQFDQEGRRTNYRLGVVLSSPNAVQMIGTWSTSSGLQMFPNIPRVSFDSSYASQRSDAPVTVLGILSDPFLIRNSDGTLQGFVVDVLNELSKEIKINFHLKENPDGKYGYQDANGTWVGLVGRLMRKEAELGVAPLTKTLERQHVIDFSKTIVTTGLNILMKKSDSDMEGSRFAAFSFLTVWSAETWVVILVVVAIYSAAGYGISRFIGAPDRVRALETKGTDSLSPCGSVWLVVGSLFCRDTGIYPRNLTHRLWAVLWGIFCIFISLLYVAMLTSSLIEVRTASTALHTRKTSQEVLKEFLSTGRPVIGTVQGGSTRRLFVNSEVGVYQQFGRFLQDSPEALTKNYDEGVERVKNSNGEYAFVMESHSSELIVSRNCDLFVTAGYLATRPYGIALQKNSTLKEIINHGILSLIETGKLTELYEKWWHSDLTSCDDPHLNMLPKIYDTSMTLHEVSGLFYLLILFSLLSVAVAAAEYFFRTQNIAVR